MPAQNPPRRRPTAPIVPPTSPPSTESPDAPDGIRWELVARMKALLAAGELDAPHRWAIAEEFLFADIESR